jgi:hypothetical protein
MSGPKQGRVTPKLNLPVFLSKLRAMVKADVNSGGSLASEMARTIDSDGDPAANK